MGVPTVENKRPPLPERRHILFGDAVYRLSYDVVDRTPATRYTVILDGVEGSVDESETVRFADLPAVDRETFAELGFASGDTIGIGTTVSYTDAERERSALVSESNYSIIVWEDGSRATWTVDGANETTLNTYHYTAERVATAAEYGGRMRERFAFELSSLSVAQRDIVETAIEQRRYVVGPDESPFSTFVSLAEDFHDREPVRGLDEESGGSEADLSQSYLVRYGNECTGRRFSSATKRFGVTRPA